MLLLRTAALLGAIASGGILAAAPAHAADVNYIELFRSNAIKCLHRTVNAEKARIEITKGPDTSGDITTVRLKTYYDGMVRHNVMETEMMIRQAGSIRQMKLNQLSDTGTGVGGCDLEKNWKDF